MKRLVILFASLAIFAAACGSSDTSAGEGGAAPASPIAEFLGQESFGFGGDNEEAQAQYVADERSRQETIAACMQGQGFEYIPVDPENLVFFEEGEEEWGSDEWVAKWGFGMSTMWFSQAEVGPNLLGYDDSGFEEYEENDPNAPYLEALSDSEREAYFAALYGDESSFPQFDDTLSDEEIEAQLEGFDFEPQGCQGEAYSQDSSTRFYQDFGDELDEMYQRVQNDPRIAEAEKKISECVAEKGLDYTSQEDFFEEVEGELSALDSTVGFPGEDLTEEDFASMTEAELDELFSQGRVLSDEIKATLADLQEREITLAVAVSECGGGFASQEAIYFEVVAEYEQEFLEQNKDRLADYGADA